MLTITAGMSSGNPVDEGSIGHPRLRDQYWLIRAALPWEADYRIMMMAECDYLIVFLVGVRSRERPTPCSTF
jgi:hypothetical protein